MAFIAIFFSRRNCHIFVGLHCQLILPEIMSEMTKADTSFDPIHDENPTFQITTTKLDRINSWSGLSKWKSPWKAKGSLYMWRIPNFRHWMLRITWSCLGYLTPWNPESRKPIFCFLQPERFAMLWTKHIPKLVWLYRYFKLRDRFISQRMVHEYHYNTLKRLLTKLDLYQNVKLQCSEDAKTIRDLMERECVI